MPGLADWVLLAEVAVAPGATAFFTGRLPPEYLPPVQLKRAAQLLIWVVLALLGLLICAATQEWQGAVVAAVNIAVAVWWYGRRRRNRKRHALAWLGYKARAIRAKIARRNRAARRPKPVFHPVPGGAR